MEREDAYRAEYIPPEPPPAEKKEGYDAYYSGKPEAANPYPHDKNNWWRNEAWKKGHEQAVHDDYSDDD
jgi:hypothetical protein